MANPTPAHNYNFCHPHVHTQIGEVGVIEKVQLNNFMCHSRMVVTFSPNVNFVLGRNGSKFTKLSECPFIIHTLNLSGPGNSKSESGAVVFHQGMFVIKFYKNTSNVKGAVLCPSTSLCSDFLQWFITIVLNCIILGLTKGYKP